MLREAFRKFANESRSIRSLTMGVRSYGASLRSGVRLPMP